MSIERSGSGDSGIKGLAKKYPLLAGMAVGHMTSQTWNAVGANPAARAQENVIERMDLENGEMTQRLAKGFETWRSTLNRMSVMTESGIQVKSVRAVHIPRPSRGGDGAMQGPAGMVRVEVTLSDGRVGQFDGAPDARDPGFSAENMDKWVIGGLIAATPEIVRFARESVQE